MIWLMTKYLLTTSMVVIISEIARRSDKLGGFIAALPLVTFLTLIWLYVEKQPMEKIANHARYTFWFVVPTLPMFLMLPILLRHFGFWVSLGLSIGLTLIVFGLFAVVMRHFGIDLL